MCKSNDDTSEIEENINKHGNSLVVNEDSSSSPIIENNCNYEKTNEAEATHNTKSNNINEDDNVLKSTCSIDKDKSMNSIPTENNNMERTTSINKDDHIKTISSTKINVESTPSIGKNEYVKPISTTNVAGSNSNIDEVANVAGCNSSIGEDGYIKTMPTVKINPHISKNEYKKTICNNNNNADDNNNNDDGSENGNKIHFSFDSTTTASVYNSNFNIYESSGDEEMWNMPPILIKKEMVNNGLNLKSAYFFDSLKYIKSKNIQENENSSHVCPFSRDFDRNSEIKILENFKHILLDLFRLKKSNLIDESLVFSEFSKPKFYAGVKDLPWKSSSSELISIFDFWEECRSLCEQFFKVKFFIKNFDSGNRVDWFPRCDDNFTLCPKFINYLDLLENILKNRYHNFKIPFFSYECRVKYIFDIIEKQTKDLETRVNFKNRECTSTDSNTNKSPLCVLKSLNQERPESRINQNARPKPNMKDEEDFNKSFLEVDKWFEDMEKAINIDSCSLDIVDTQNKLKQYAEVEAAVISYQDNVDAFKYFGKLLNTQKTFEQLSIASKIEILETRYNALRKTVDDKKSALESSLKGLQMLRKLEDEYIWIQNKEPFCCITSYGINLKRVSSLIAKHRALIDELKIHEPIIKEFSTSLETLDAPSVIIEMIRSKVNLINEKWLLLKSNASQRSIRLHYSKLVHQFYSTLSIFKKLFSNNENSDHLNGFDISLQDVENYQQKIKLMDNLVVKISSALKKNKDLEKLDICKKVFISKDDDTENMQQPSLIIEKENDIDVIRRKHEEIKVSYLIVIILIVL